MPRSDRRSATPHPAQLEYLGSVATVVASGNAPWVGLTGVVVDETKNTFVLEFTTAQDKKPVDAGKVSLNTSMTMQGMAPMIAGATLTPDGPGRYRGTIEFPDRGTRQVTVTWDGPGGKGSTKFSVPVR